MLYKCLGAFFLLLAGGYLSVFFNRMERRRLQVLDAYIALIRYIKGQIDCYAMPMEEILTRADPHLLRTCMGQGRTYLHDKDEPVLYLPFHEMVTESRLYLEPESERLLSAFARELGQTYRHEQVMRCEHYIQALGEERRKLSETAPIRVRMNSILCLCCALGVAVVLW